ncbi:MAG: (d)CMP kinase, partial [Chlamydiia bacterium]|nr:(d)CMP kinase [Chlamydiia bacterium]
MIIAIDGPSGTGKSTIAKKIAKKLGFSFFDTGAIYRSLAWWLRKEGIDFADEMLVANRLKEFQYEVRQDGNKEKHYLVQGEDVTAFIRGQEISQIASQIATQSAVRKAMTEIQRRVGGQGSAVFEGRDMGTVVFPDAEIKIFLTALPEVRARRRYEELLLKFPELADSLRFDQILQETQERDLNDTTRQLAPLKQASDAILIDTSHLSIDQVTKKILQLVAKRRKYPPMRLPYKICYWTARVFFKIFFRLKVYGIEHVQTGPAILAANHTSHFDPPVLSASCPEEVFFLAKASLFQVPILGRLIRLLNARPVSGTSTDAATFREIIHLLQSGKKVILFPEGTRSPDGNLQSLERGLGFIANKARSPILPAYIDGTFSAWPLGKKFPKLFGQIRVVFGPPIDWEDFEGLEKRDLEKKLTERTEQAIHDLKEWLE